MATLIDSGEATAARVASALREHDIVNPSKEHPNVQFSVSDTPGKFTEIGEQFLGRKLGVVKRVDVG